MPVRSSSPVPAALRPTPKRTELHIVFVVPDDRLQRLLAERTYVIQPPYFKGEIKVHAVNEAWASDRDLFRATATQRQALLELGLVHPEDVEFKNVPLTLGWERDE
jgi:hypothetical protein